MILQSMILLLFFMAAGQPEVGSFYNSRPSSGIRGFPALRTFDGRRVACTTIQFRQAHLPSYRKYSLRILKPSVLIQEWNLNMILQRAHSTSPSTGLIFKKFKKYGIVKSLLRRAITLRKIAGWLSALWIPSFGQSSSPFETKKFGL